MLANGVEVSTISVTVVAGNGAPLANRVVQLTATGTNNTIAQPAVTDSNGQTSGTIASTTAEIKTITVTIDPGADAVVLTQQPTVQFVADSGSISGLLTTATAAPATGVLANGSAISMITVTVRDINGNPIADQAVQLTSTGSNNTLVQPSLTNASGVATGTIASTTAEAKTITATINPGASQVVCSQQPTVQFVGDPNNLSALLSTVTAAPATGVIADGTAISLITVTLRDTNGNLVAGQAVQLSSTGSNNTFVQPSVTNSSGVATGTIASTTAETKTITATVNPGATQVVLTQQPTVQFVGDPSTINALQTTATAAPTLGVPADGSTTSTVTVTVRDSNGNPVAGQAVQLASTGSNNTLVQPGLTDASGVATGTIATTTAETKTITATVNPGANQVVVAQQPTVQFVGNPTSISGVLTTATAAPAAGVIADGTTLSTITVTVRDINGNPVAGQAVQLVATGSNNTLVQPSVTNASGVATGTIASTTAETKTITATVNPGASQVLVAQQPTVQFVGDPSTINALQSTAAASPATGVIADGTTLSTITVTVRDVNGNPVAGQAVQLVATGSNNTLVQPGVTNASGVATGTIASTTAETKTVTATVNPGAGQVVASQQPTVQFVGDPNNVSALLSTATAAPALGVIADGTALSTITVTVRDVNGNAVAGLPVQLAATGSNNTLIQPGLTDPSGVATGTIASITAETKTITATVDPGASQTIVAQQPTVQFVGDPSTINALQSTATAAPAVGVIADGTAISTITVTVRDVNGNPVAGQAISLAATGSNNTLVQPGLTDAFGVATGTIASITAETKTITATINPGASQVVAAQQPTVQFVGDPSTINALLSTATAAPTLGVLADGITTSTITVTVRDSNGNPVAGQAVGLAATGSNNTLVQ
ncbi:MAG TPA: Ig-like domain-containing protein, partial [Planctomycetota bacterium]